MAQLTERKATANKPAETAPVNPADNANDSNVLVFESHDDIPRGAEVNAASNPFQPEVNKLRAGEKKASAVVLPKDREKWGRTMVRRAVQAIDDGTVGLRTRVTPVENDKTKIRLWFTLVEKTPRNATK